MGEGAIDGRGGAALISQKVSWWDLAQEAKVKNLNSERVPRLMQLSHCDNFTLYRITLRNSPNFHVVIQRRQRIQGLGIYHQLAENGSEYGRDRS